jgi:hypothetical protein
MCIVYCTVLYLLAYWECDVTQGEVSKTREMGGKISAQCTCMCIVLYLLAHWECDVTRVSPFRKKNFFAYKRSKANLDLFHMCFTISL